jgi:hypothetical protein
MSKIYALKIYILKIYIFFKTLDIDKLAKEFNYLLNMNLWALTWEKVEELKKQF